MRYRRQTRILQLMLFLSLIGLLVTGYQTYEHYFVASSACDLSQTFSCSLVTASEFGEFPPNSGIATAGWGVIWWILFLTGAIQQYRGAGTAYLPFYLFSWLLLGLLFVIYLLVVEFYILPQQHGTLVICPFCTIQHGIIILLVGAQYTLLKQPLSLYLQKIFYTSAEETR